MLKPSIRDKANLFLGLVVFLLFFSCTGHGTIHDYPDCIRYPNHYRESQGCGNLFVYQFLDSARALTVSINPDSLKRTEYCQTFLIGNGVPAADVKLEIAGNDPDSIYFNFCSDTVYTNMGKTTTYEASQGKVTISLLFDERSIVDYVPKTFHYLSIRITDLVFIREPLNDNIIIDKAVFWDVMVAGKVP